MRSLFAWRPLRRQQYSHGLYIWHWLLSYSRTAFTAWAPREVPVVFVLVSFPDPCYGISKRTLCGKACIAHICGLYFAYPRAGPAEAITAICRTLRYGGGGTADGTDEAADGDKKG